MFKRFGPTMAKSLILVIVDLFFCVAQSAGDDVRLTHVCTVSYNISGPCLVVGNSGTYDERVLVDESFEKMSIPFMTRTTDLVLPEGGWSTNNVITFVQVSNPGNSGQVTMTQGGPGYKTVSLHLESPRGAGYSFQVLIKGIDTTPVIHSNFEPALDEATDTSLDDSQSHPI